MRHIRFTLSLIFSLLLALGAFGVWGRAVRPAVAREAVDPTPYPRSPIPTRSPDHHTHLLNRAHLPSTPPYTQTGAQACLNDLSGGLYPCHNLSLLARVALNNFSTAPFAASNLWGFVSLNDQREYALVGLYNGTAILDVTDPVHPTEVGTITAMPSSWREIKTYQFFDSDVQRWRAYAYVVTETPQSSGLQIIDLSDLPAQVSLRGVYTGVTTAHTLFISNVDMATGVTLPGQTSHLYLNGARLQGAWLGNGGVRILSLADPANPVEIGHWDGGYMHDLEVITVSDTRATQYCAPTHVPCEVILGWQGLEGFSIIDVTDKAAPLTLSTLFYDGLGYAHSGWLSPDARYVYAMDELDEEEGSVQNSTIRIFDISNLITPTVAYTWTGTSRAIDHNGMFVGDIYFFANYKRGLTILDASQPTAPREIAYFDTFPADDRAEFDGAWGVYPFLPSGMLLVSDISGGLFILKDLPYRLYIPVVQR